MTEKDKELILVLKRFAEDLVSYMRHVDESGGVSTMTDLYEHAICDCINRIGDGVKRMKELQYNAKCQKSWTGLRIYSAHKYEKLNFSIVWDALSAAAADFIAESDLLLSSQ